MQVRELYKRFLSLPNERAGAKYEAALQLWEQHTRNPVAGDLTGGCVDAFRQNCAAAGIVGRQFNGCWRYLRSILKAAAGNGVVVPYFDSRE